MLDGFSHSHSLGGDILVLIAAVARSTFRTTHTLGDGRSSQQLDHIFSGEKKWFGKVQKELDHIYDGEKRWFQPLQTTGSHLGRRKK